MPVGRRQSIDDHMTLFARHGRLTLIAGLAVGIAFPALADIMRGSLTILIASLLLLSAYRIGLARVAGSLADARRTLLLVLVLQVALPLALWLATLPLPQAGLVGTLAAAVVLLTASSSIAGAPNIVAMTGHDGASALRLLILGTALLPFTVIPTFLAIGLSVNVLDASLRLLAIIALACGLGFALRRFTDEPDAGTIARVDGWSALLMGVVVIGLMSAVGPALRDAPATLGWTLLAAFAANFGLQLLAAALLPASPDRAGQAFVAGNRNMALFLAALPPGATEPMMLFIGCYQIPMYLTPVLLGRFYRQLDAGGGSPR